MNKGASLVPSASSGVYRAMAEHSGTLLAYLDLHFNFVSVNSAYARGSGHPAEELIGRNHFDLFPNEENQAIFAAVRDTGQPIEYRAKPFEYADQPKRGVTYWDWVLSPVKGDDEQVIGLVLSLTEVTQAVLAHKARQESEERYRNLFAGMREGFALHELIYDESGKAVDYRFIDANPAFGELTGLDPAAVIGKTVREVLPDTEDYWIAAFADVVFTGKAVRLENYSREIGRWFEVVAYRPAAGQFAAVFSDITERRRAAEALQSAANELERRVAERTAELAEANRSLRESEERFRASIEIERRTIARELHDEAGQALTSLKIGIGLLQRDPAFPSSLSAQAESLKAVTDEVMRNLHDLAIRLRPGALDRQGLLPAVEQYIEQFRQQNSLEVDLLAEGFDDARLPNDVEINAYRLVQESLTNVARHSGATCVGVALCLRTGSLLLVIEDDGQGFDVDGAQGQGRLGLVGMRERAMMLGGRFVIESAPGRGTTIIAELPCDYNPADPR